MKKTLIVNIISILSFVVGFGMSNANDKCNNTLITTTDSISFPNTLDSIYNITDSIKTSPDSICSHRPTLTENDYILVAEQLNIEVAVMKAVVKIEAGASLKGFWAPGVPVVSFEQATYNRLSKIAATKKAAADTKIPEGINSSYGKKKWQQLINARKKNEDRANMSTFWGMFQIGGFNYKLCGCLSIDEFVTKMSTSELEQLKLFAAFITNTKIVKYLQQKKWSAFARKYNGPGYAKRGYHTKLAKAYNQFKKQ